MLVSLLIAKHIVGDFINTKYTIALTFYVF